MYRDAAPLPCPNCGGPLAAFEEGREKWRCRQCGGTLVGRRQLKTELGKFEIGAELKGPTGPCPLCREPMTAFVLRGQEVARCVREGHIWFERGILGRVRSAI